MSDVCRESGFMSDVCREWVWGIRLMGLGHTEWMAGLFGFGSSVKTGTEEDDKMSGLNGIKLS
jgi:hypothetical protein